MLIKAFDGNLPELPISIGADGDGYRCYGDIRETSAKIKSVIESAEQPVVAEIQNGKVPFNTKAGLVDYVKAHIGDKVRVIFNNGASEVRALESISNSSMRTKKTDGSDSVADLRGIKYNDTGFTIDYSTGVSATYDFVNTADSVENYVAETTESVSNSEKTEGNTPDSVSEETSKAKKNDLFKKLTDSIPLLENDAVVYEATGNEFEVGEKKLSQQVYEYFESLGGVVHRDNFDDVDINDKGVDSSIAHGMGRAKAIAFASVPAVIEKGRQIDFVENWKGRNYDSNVFKNIKSVIESESGKDYNENTRYSQKWRTDLSQAQYKEVMTRLRRESNHEDKRITDTANWYMGRLAGDDLFIIYSTIDVADPTIFYEIKGANARAEQKILLDLLEGIENGENNDGKSVHVDEVSGSGWMQKGSGSQNNLRHLGAGQNNQNVGVLQGQSQRNGSRAFRNVIENILGISEQSRNDLLSGNSGRRNNESSGKQIRSLSENERRNRGKTEAERKEYAATVLEQGNAKEKVVKNVKVNTVNTEAYNEDMLSISEANKQKGINTHYFVGDAIKMFDGKRALKIDGFVIGNDVYLRYDGKVAPQMLNLHELVHFDYYTAEIQAAKEYILSSLTDEEIDKILASDRYQKYADVYGNKKERILEEFIADVLAGMNEYTYNFAELVNDYWNGDKQFIDKYKVSEYSNLIDTGDSNASVLENIGFGNEYSLSESFDDIPPREYLQLRDYIMNKNNSADVLSPTDCKEIGNNFYIWNNASKTDFTVVGSIPIVGNKEFINAIRSDIQNGTIRNTQRISEWVAGVRGGRRDGTIFSSMRKGTTSNGNDDRFSLRPSGSNARRYTGGDSSDSQRSQVIRYALDTYDNDSESLTPERKKEIFEQFEKDRAGMPKQTQKEIWGERAAWVAHNMTRVFPEIPERGEKGTFFAEFRKNMIYK